MRLYLLEKALFDINIDGNVIALTPEACYQLDKQGIKYSIIEDYCEKPPIEEYIVLFNKWIDRLDAVLGTGLQLANLYAFYWRYRVLEQLFMKCHMVNSLFDSLHPSEVVFITQSNREPLFDSMMATPYPSYYSQIVPKICKERNISLEVIYSEGIQREIGASFSLRSNKTVQNLFFTFKRFTAIGRLKADRKLNIFMPKTVHIGTDFIVKASNRGHMIYGTNQDTQKVPVVFNGSDITSWFNDLFRCDVSEIVSQRLKFFVSEICPLVLGYYEDLLAHFKICGIDMILMPHDTTPRDSATLLAARELGIKRVCISHGDGAYNSINWEQREVELYNSIIVSNFERKQYYEQLGAKEVYVSPHRLLPALNLNKRHGRKIVYCSAFFGGDNRGFENVHTDTRLYMLQREIVKYLSLQNGYSFVFKGLPQSDLVYNPIPDFIRDNNFRNITVSSKPLIKHLKNAARVICDNSSTGFYEAVAAGVPAMSLCHRSWTCRKSALDYFGNMIKQFDTIEEAIAEIDRFLNDNPENYLRKLDTGNRSIFDILEQQCQ
jgi:hypothetical protein